MAKMKKKPTATKLVHKPLHCPICGTRFMNMFGNPLPNHNQIRCTTERGDTMDIGVCERCNDSGVDVDTGNAILAGIADYWVYEIEADKTIKTEEKNARKKVHQGHKIASMQKVTATGKRAEKEARVKGRLL